MNILHVTPSFYPATYWGGPTYSLYGLCNALGKIEGLVVRVLSTDTAGPRVDQRVAATEPTGDLYKGYEVVFCRRTAGDAISFSLLAALPGLIRSADVIHLNAVYSFPTLPTLLLCRIYGKPLVWSARGALQRWKNSKRKALKAIWEHICGVLLYKDRTTIHVTSREESIAARARFECQVTQIPNGVEVPNSIPLRDWMPMGQLRVLYIGRLDPIKGIPNLLKAVALLGEEGITVTICGTGEHAYVEEMHVLVRSLGLSERVTFLGHVERSEKTAVFFSADLCVVPSYSENFGMVIAEALAHGVPVIASTGTPWQEIESRKVGRWVSNEPESLAAAINAIRGEDLATMGRRGREWMASEYAWGVVAERMLALYRAMLFRRAEKR